jgi:membrane-bound metal-dependent hydrolase YbcI (DUF457 family)
MHAMKIPEHLALSYLLAQFGVQQDYGGGGTALLIAAGMLPDLDGLAILGGWRCHDRYHRVIGHGLPVTLLGPALLAVMGSLLFGLGPLLPLWLWLQLGLLLHLLSDVCFYDWPTRVLWPFSRYAIGFGWISWNDLVPTLLLYGGMVGCVCGAPLVSASVSLGALAGYLAWRAWRPRSRCGWAGWLTGDWAEEASPVWRWLTGDFVPTAVCRHWRTLVQRGDVFRDPQAGLGGLVPQVEEG